MVSTILVINNKHRCLLGSQEENGACSPLPVLYFFTFFFARLSLKAVNNNNNNNNDRRGWEAGSEAGEQGNSKSD